MTAATGLNARAVGEIQRTFNSLTNSYATVSEYIAHFFPGEQVWRGDECGCTDDRCTGYHHEGPVCGCLDVQLDQFHDDLSVAYGIREWIASRADRDLVVAALEVLYTWSRDIADRDGLDTRLTPAQSEVLGELFVSATHLDRKDYVTAVNRVGVDVLKPSATSSQQEGK